MKTLYPLKFKPIFKEKIWGGQKIRTTLGLDFSPLPNCGEAWVISGVKGCESKVVNGFLKGNKLNELVEIFMDDLVGEKVFETNQEEFPILIKFIDSHDWLSIQVHPDDKLAAKRMIGSGKTEMWYIIDADETAELISGFSVPADQKTYLKSLQEKKLKEILNFEHVRKDDAFFIPSGRIHALGPGILLAEIQQTSDTTYRIYDWDRVDEKGKSRELNTDLALEAIDFTFHESYRTRYKPEKNKTSQLVECNHFVTNLLDLDHPLLKDYSELDSFVIYTVVSGRAVIQNDSNKEILTIGETLLIPAILQNIIIIPQPECKILETWIP